MSEKTKNKYNQKSVYIPDKFLDFWDELQTEAEEKGRGVGAHICRQLKKFRAMMERGAL